MFDDFDIAITCEELYTEMDMNDLLNTLTTEELADYFGE